MKLISTSIFNKKKHNKRDFDLYLETRDFIRNNIELDQYYNFLYKNTKEVIEGYEDNKKILLRGDVQSGKTNNLIFLMNELIEKKGVKLFLYCTGRLNDLNIQNLKRIRSAFGVMDKKVETFDAKGNNFNYENIENLLETNDVVIISAIKRVEFIESFSLVAKTLEIKNPIFIDDESDDVSLSLKFHSSVNSFIEINGSGKYIQITATPYKNLYNFQSFYDLYKNFDSPKTYTGLDVFVNKYKPLNTTSNETKFFAPLLHFVTTVLAHNLEEAEMLISLSDTNSMQKNIQNMIIKNIKILKQYINESDLSICNSIRKKGVNPKDVYQFLTKLYGSIFIYNGYGKNAKHDYRKKILSTKIKVIIGGISLSRGITFNDLITQVLVKSTEANKFNASDIMQRSRWFGHRELVDFMKIYMNKELISAYEEMKKFDSMVKDFKLNSNFKEEFDKLELEKISEPIYVKEKYEI